jgi:hypothetical protein
MRFYWLAHDKGSERGNATVTPPLVVRVTDLGDSMQRIKIATSCFKVTANYFKRFLN